MKNLSLSKRESLNPASILSLLKSFLRLVLFSPLEQRSTERAVGNVECPIPRTMEPYSAISSSGTLVKTPMPRQESPIFGTRLLGSSSLQEVRSEVLGPMIDPYTTQMSRRVLSSRFLPMKTLVLTPLGIGNIIEIYSNDLTERECYIVKLITGSFVACPPNEIMMSTRA